MNKEISEKRIEKGISIFLIKNRIKYTTEFRTPNKNNKTKQRGILCRCKILINHR